MGGFSFAFVVSMVDSEVSKLNSIQINLKLHRFNLFFQININLTVVNSVVTKELKLHGPCFICLGIQ